MRVFNRSRFATAERIGDHHLKIIVFNIDDIHALSLELEIDWHRRVITKAAMEWVRVPYTLCNVTEHIVERLVGLGIGTGAIEKVRKAIGGPDGCTQIFDLVVEALQVVYQCEYAFYPGGSIELVEKNPEQFNGICYTHSRPLEERLATHRFQKYR